MNNHSATKCAIGKLIFSGNNRVVVFGKMVHNAHSVGESAIKIETIEERSKVFRPE